MHYCTLDDDESCVTFNDKTVVVRGGSSMLQTTIYALQCALTSNPTDSNTAQFRERSRTFPFSLRGEGK